MSKKKIIVVGGGTAGLTIANRLQDSFDVTVIEKSQYSKYPICFGIPLMVGILFRKKLGSYINKRELRLADGRLIPFFESNLWGGSSVMNGCVHVFGFRSKWEKELRRFGFSFDALLQSNKDLFSNDLSQSRKITVRPAHQNLVDKAFIQTLAQVGIPPDDMSCSEKEACGPIVNTVRKVLRTSVLSLQRKKKYKRLMNERVTEILINEGGKINGVRTDRGTHSADVVIVSAGVIGSCSLLLKEKQKPKSPLLDVPVGDQIQDHTNLRVNVLATRPIGSLNETYSRLGRKLLLGLKHVLGVPTVMRGTGATSAAYLDLDGDGKVDTRIQILQFAETGRHGSKGSVFDTDLPSFSISINAIHPESTGQVYLEGDRTVVDPRFLSASKDMEILKLALEYCIKLLKTPPISDLVQEIIAEEQMLNDPEKYIRDNIYSGHHLNGGLHRAIDSDLGVRNANGLYVCDASVFEGYVASNIHSSVVLLADLFARRFVERNASS
ncbi:MAG: GMC family oxidoreductase [Leptospiraceae bacterium]|nr:GMC family oxidoreductase [Leptospiraceae bacterium]